MCKHLALRDQQQQHTWTLPGLLLMCTWLDPGRDLELLRVKLLEEVESSYRAKCDNLTKASRGGYSVHRFATAQNVAYWR